MHKNKGFTLVELAIVIVIIGLLVGGVLQGQELIKQAEVRNNIKRMQNIITAATTFKAKYNCIPGDCNRAASYGLYFNGDGDEQITFLADGGNTYFWLHLVTAKMLTTTNRDGSAITNTNFTYVAKFREDKGGNFGYMYASYGDLYRGQTPGWPWSDASVSVMAQGNLVTITSMVPPNQLYATFTPEETRIIDEKTDDGKPLTGKFYGANARKVEDYNIVTVCNNSGNYVNDDSADACRILFQLGI